MIQDESIAIGKVKKSEVELARKNIMMIVKAMLDRGEVSFDEYID
jgi:flagellar motor switch protein FliG